jgi:hypothetical protein
MAQADQRPPEAVLDEVISECESALRAKYGADEDILIRLRPTPMNLAHRLPMTRPITSDP